MVESSFSGLCIDAVSQREGGVYRRRQSSFGGP